MRKLGFLTISFATIMSAYAQPNYDRLDRESFNRLAQQTNVPLFWRNDANSNNVIEPTEMTYLLGLNTRNKISDYINQGKFTPLFKNAYESMVKLSRVTQPDPDTIKNPERKRRALVVEELNQAKPTLIESDFSKGTAEDKAIIQHMLTISALIDSLYHQQNGVYGWESKIPKDDTASRTMFYRNQGPFCLNPKTENNPDCNALPEKPKRVVGVYPATLQADKNFCQTIQTNKDAASLSQPFVTVVEKNGQLTTVPYTTAYSASTRQIANELKATANSIKDPKEAAFKEYLNAAAQAFTDNNWYAADEAWAKMNATNSKWYLRVGPDEQYWEPCSLKAGFHVSFATINKDSLIWQEKLDPLKNEMEKILADLAGPPYKSHPVNFHLPDFIDIVMNAGDSRAHTGGTIGQSLPNSGPVANEGRGRTVVMANLSFPNEDSRKQAITTISSLFCPKTMAQFVADPKLDNMSTVLHEAAHNLGPAHEYTVDGKKDKEIFGGEMASMLEELKAQTSALYFLDWLVSKKMIDQKTAEQTYLNDVRWGFGHISRGMYTSDGSYKAYSQLAAIQFGALINGGALVWRADQEAANGQDQGCFEVDMVKFRGVVAQLEKTVLGIKSRGDKAQAESLRKQMVDNDENLTKLHKIIAERIQRSPSLTFVYSVHQ